MLSYVFETRLDFSESVTDHSFVLRCLPRQMRTQKVLESQVFTHPRIPLSEQVDGLGNRIVVGYCPEAHEAFDYHASGLVMVDSADETPEDAHPMFLQFTPLTMPDNALRAYAELVRTETEDEGAWEIAKRASALVFDEFEYSPGATSTKTAAAEAFSARRGVCQDYAHVLIAICRILGIPARYVAGLMVGEGATHAWVEIHDGIRWRGVDPTHNSVVDDRYMVFAIGRDFDDCPIERGVFRGNAQQTQRVSTTLSSMQE